MPSGIRASSLYLSASHLFTFSLLAFPAHLIPVPPFPGTRHTLHYNITTYPAGQDIISTSHMQNKQIRHTSFADTSPSHVLPNFWSPYIYLFQLPTH